VFDNQASGGEICDISSLIRSLDRWAQDHGTAWEGERDEGEKEGGAPRRRLVLVSSIENPISHAPAQALFVYRQKGKNYDIELMLNVSKSDMRMMNYSGIHDLWMKVYSACRRDVLPPANNTNSDG
jgi:hypothetical protein